MTLEPNWFESKVLVAKMATESGNSRPRIVHGLPLSPVHAERMLLKQKLRFRSRNRLEAKWLRLRSSGSLSLHVMSLYTGLNPTGPTIDSIDTGGAVMSPYTELSP